MPQVTLATIVLLALASASAVVHLVAHYRGKRRLIRIAKPLTTILILAAAMAIPAADPFYRTAVGAGLLLSLAGDVLLLFPERFAAGLASFLAAHVAYTIAFCAGIGFGAKPMLAIPYAIVAAILLPCLWPRLGSLRVPVFFYVVALLVMAWQAAARAALLPGAATTAAAAGAALFVISDATLAVNRFRRPFPAYQAVVMPTYVVAQALIALSIAH